MWGVWGSSEKSIISRTFSSYQKFHQLHTRFQHCITYYLSRYVCRENNFEIISSNSSLILFHHFVFFFFNSIFNNILRNNYSNFKIFKQDNGKEIVVGLLLELMDGGTLHFFLQNPSVFILCLKNLYITLFLNIKLNIKLEIKMENKVKIYNCWWELPKLLN